MSTSDISFTSLGLVVLDEIRVADQTPLTNVVGGSGAYEKETDKPSTRGLLAYEDTTFGPKDFKYTTPVLAVQDSSIASTALLGSKVFHYLQAPHDIISRIESLLALRHKASITNRPLIIWEPAPPSCQPENLQTCLEAAALVDVFSPNHLELAAFFGESLSPSSSASASASDKYPEKDKTKTRIDELALKFVDSGVGPSRNGLVLIRAGEHGCLLRSRTLPSPMWFPPFYDLSSDSRPQKQHAKVIDPTGAGNAFLGAFAVGYVKTDGSVVEAACYGSVGASFALEQVGMPKKTEEGGEELWNGVTAFSRLREYMSRSRVDVR
ncbi:hypothetical protein N7510_001164 [Penicillium lagena]|uniref:uncharacterized protein n=1 Tax=Penicillium lagena TaxID=94218 RepID=UPI002540D970|nr:uncharacterized protein N7510_001164 [Penicillium lagena]KAJ5624855.1 hypothetical protein N7510_001164 [Penicillium lagena]